MKRNLLLVFLGMVAGLAIGLGGVGAGEPGDVSDPLVSESYVREMGSFKMLELAPGRDLGMRGGSEVLVTSGDLTVKSASTSIVIDLTDGKQLTDLGVLPRNHLLLALSTTGGDVVLTAEGGASILKRGF